MGLLAERWFGFSGAAARSHSARHDQANAQALGSALLFFCLAPWTGTLLVYTGAGRHSLVMHRGAADAFLLMHSVWGRSHGRHHYFFRVGLLVLLLRGMHNHAVHSAASGSPVRPRRRFTTTDCLVVKVGCCRQRSLPCPRPSGL